MTNIAPKTIATIPTKVKFRMIQLKVGQTVSGRCFGPVLTVPFYAVKRNEPRRLTGINRDTTVEIFGIQGRTGVYWRAVTFVLIKRSLEDI